MGDEEKISKHQRERRLSERCGQCDDDRGKPRYDDLDSRGLEEQLCNRPSHTGGGGDGEDYHQCDLVSSLSLSSRFGFEFTTDHRTRVAISEPSPRVTVYDYSPVQESFRDALLKGLAQPWKSIPSRFLYDDEGSRLFDQICELPEYYVTRAECGILCEKKIEIASAIGPGAALIEFGAGSSLKARLVFDALEKPVAYVPIDVSRAHLIRLATEIANDNPEIRVVAVCADYTKPLQLPAFPARRVGFFPGSSIGNLSKEEARDFLSLWAPQLSVDGAMIVGVDMKKDESILLPAYDDAAGTTATFSLNVLRRANRETGADFKLAKFTHKVTNDNEAGRVAIYLESQEEQFVTVDGQKFHFDAGELLHLEDSNKYTISEFQAIARDAGYVPVDVWTDPKNLFSVHVLRVPSKT